MHRPTFGEYELHGEIRKYIRQIIAATKTRPKDKEWELSMVSPEFIIHVAA
jgi:hypothetical protein